MKNIKNKINFNDSLIFSKNLKYFEVIYDFFKRNNLKFNNCVFIDIHFKKAILLIHLNPKKLIYI